MPPWRQNFTSANVEKRRWITIFWTFENVSCFRLLTNLRVNAGLDSSFYGKDPDKEMPLLTKLPEKWNLVSKMVVDKVIFTN
ncbi:hypothetical protein B7992_07900 [Fibrobacter sp. UWH1]|nr:hypothetical protein B7992_07900 [Fibrobacter sp. UWH1]